MTVRSPERPKSSPKQLISFAWSRMPITNAQIQSAKTTQDAAAHNGSPQVRLVAGPGTGKSFSIEERVCWLLRGGVQPDRMAVVSFTRAASRELRDRIRVYCLNETQAGGRQVRV